ncbi:hypothetical protein CY34DRAFT_16776 [Suillus luteus UH-Slu-Lm8-n1]|uniref:F-box domain-containing protein n=1 Tax=Suillus luteus UH-Slu-Lm8-n1 TaxID=930992 RepID=A0A0D0A256_9AGAM|nr:hypothetical protein CY34DRAFT_16776 [Suillus luteus UH-Slu-Lm8-n1]
MLQCLPNEIERIIFRIATTTHPIHHLPSYLLVAGRVHDWVEELMYHTVILTSEFQGRGFVDSCPLASAKVKALCLGGNLQLTTAARILELCRSIDDLALWVLPGGDVPDVPACLLIALNRLPLSRLSVRLSAIFCRTAAPYLPSIPLFEKVTHLELLEGWVLWGFPTGIHHLTQLTHLSLRAVAHQTAPALLKMILTDCASLEVLFLRVIDGVEDIEAWLKAEGFDDPRITVVTATDPRNFWDCLTSDETKTWNYGDDIMKSHQSGTSTL